MKNQNKSLEIEREPELLKQEQLFKCDIKSDINKDDDSLEKWMFYRQNNNKLQEISDFFKNHTEYYTSFNPKTFVIKTGRLKEVLDINKRKSANIDMLRMTFSGQKEGAPTRYKILAQEAIIEFLHNNSQGKKFEAIYANLYNDLSKVKPAKDVYEQKNKKSLWDRGFWGKVACIASFGIAPAIYDTNCCGAGCCQTIN